MGGNLTLWYWYERNWKKQRLLMEMEIVSDRNTPQGIETNILQNNLSYDIAVIQCVMNMI